MILLVLILDFIYERSKPIQQMKLHMIRIENVNISQFNQQMVSPRQTNYHLAAKISPTTRQINNCLVSYNSVERVFI